MYILYRRHRHVFAHLKQTIHIKINIRKQANISVVKLEHAFWARTLLET